MNAQPPRDPHSAYYRDAASWADDARDQDRASGRIAWRVAGAALAIAVIEAIALVALIPMRRPVPLPILVDRQTGYVQAMTDLSPGALTQNEAVTRSYLARYILARETFDAADLNQAYRKVMLWSSGDARRDYASWMSRATPDSPLNLDSPSTRVAVTLESLSLTSPTTALARFTTQRQDAGGPPQPIQSFAATLAFRYVDAPMSMADRLVNPLGFQVTSYRRDSEAPLASGPGAPP